MSLDPRVHLEGETGLREPVMLAAWPGMGRVALRSVLHLKEALEARDLGWIDGDDFFRVAGVQTRGGVVLPAEFPENRLYVSRGVAPSRAHSTKCRISAW